MDTKKLRQKILDLAIRGKLVPQDPNDEPASVLLERIRAEKERLIKEGKIKRSKKSSSDTPQYENVPFEVPESWEWVRLDAVGDIVTGSTPPKDNKDFYGGHIPFYKPTDLEQGINTTTSTDTLTEQGFAVARQLPRDTILVTCIGATIGKTGMIRKAGTCNQQINAIVSYPSVFPEYIYCACISDYMQSCIKENASATTLPILNKNHFAELQIPLPPTEEQKRIVAAIELWFSLIETLETAKEDLQTSIAQAKSKILDLAIHGKLVPQDPNDEPAIELLKRINPSFVPCDNAHYENIPEGWTVCALEEIIDYEQPQAYIVQSTDYKSQYKIPVLTAGKSFIIGYTDESDGVFTDLPVIIFDDFTTESKFVDFPFKVKSSAMKILHVKKEVNIHYVCWFMSITRLIGDTHKRYWISEYSKLHIPIPPRKEQDSIINKVNELFQILDNISVEL
jgi:type I restriction enzyme S subunit